MNRAAQILLTLALTLALAPCQWAQQEEPSEGAQEAPPSVPAEEPSASTTLQPDTRPLFGVEEARVESPARARNFVVPSLRISSFGDSNRTILSTGNKGVELTGSVVGNLEVHRVSRRNEFTFDYTGGGMFYARDSQLNATMHQLGFMETYKGRRWGLTIGDHISHLPESAYGFGGFGSSAGFGGGFGGSLGNMNPGFGAGQNMFTGRGSRTVNTALTELHYTASARSSLNFSGSYGIMRFQDAGNIESDFGMVAAGYNHSISRRDTLGVTYGLSAFRFKGSDFHMDNHFVQLSYGRRLTGKMALELSGGPQFTVFRTPASGSTHKASWSAHTSLNTRFSRTNLGLSYSHYTSAGSGLLFGASTDRFYGTVTNQFTRNWTWSVGPGYSRNTRLRQGPTLTTASAYNSVYATTGLHRALGRYTDISFTYSLHDQWSDATSPTGINSGSSYLRHMFGVSLTWHTERIALN